MNLNEAYLTIVRKYKSNPSVVEIAEKMGVGSSYFIKKFKEEFNESPRELVHRLQLMWAEVQVSKTNRSMGDIARDLGTDPSWFGVMFRRHYGISPLQYRKNRRRNRKSRK